MALRWHRAVEGGGPAAAPRGPDRRSLRKIHAPPRHAAFYGAVATRLALPAVRLPVCEEEWWTSTPGCAGDDGGGRGRRGDGGRSRTSTPRSRLRPSGQDRRDGRTWVELVGPDATAAAGPLLGGFWVYLVNAPPCPLRPSRVVGTRQWQRDSKPLCGGIRAGDGAIDRHRM